jgi:methyl-accepting chemotaxis protein
MRFSIRAKLGLTFAAIIALSAVTAVLGINSLSSLNIAMKDMVAGPVERLQIAEELLIDLLQVARAEKNMVLSTAPDQIAAFETSIQEARLSFAARLERGERIASVEGRPLWAAIHNVWPQYMAADDKVRDLAKRGEIAKAQEASVIGAMSATSEELAAQSEQLQASIAYFRINMTSANEPPVRVLRSEPVDASGVNEAPHRRSARLLTPSQATHGPGQASILTLSGAVSPASIATSMLHPVASPLISPMVTPIRMMPIS